MADKNQYKVKLDLIVIWKGIDLAPDFKMFHATTLSLMAIACVTMATHSAIASRLDDKWKRFKEQYSKRYNLPGEESVRRGIWESNLKYITMHNREADKGFHTFWLGENEFADMTNKEFVSVINGYRLANGTASGYPCKRYWRPFNVELKDLPATVDWRKEGYVTPVKNQGQCGSCWAFSTTGSLEGQHFNKTKNLISLSEQNLIDCSNKEGNKGCSGGLMTQAFDYVIQNGGIDTEESYPYKDGVSSKRLGRRCKFSTANIGATMTGCKYIPEGSEKDLQYASALIGPISVAIDASHGSFQLYKSGIYTEKSCSSHKLDHGVLVVGYGNQGQDYWLVKNSWGTKWGMQGYIMMARNDHNMCGIATQASFPTV